MMTLRSQLLAQVPQKWHRVFLASHQAPRVAVLFAWDGVWARHLPCDAPFSPLLSILWGEISGLQHHLETLSYFAPDTPFP